MRTSHRQPLLSLGFYKGFYAIHSVGIVGKMEPVSLQVVQRVVLILYHIVTIISSPHNAGLNVNCGTNAFSASLLLRNGVLADLNADAICLQELWFGIGSIALFKSASIEKIKEHTPENLRCRRQLPRR